MTKSAKPKSKTFEFLTLFVMVIGTVVGAGIYLKNTEIVEQTHNPIIAILLWLIVGIVCLFAIVVFFEISSSTKNSGNGTLGTWLKLFLNRRVASFFSSLYVVLYVPAYNALFTGMFIFFFLQVLGIDLSWQEMLTIYIVLGVAMLIAFHILSALSFETAKAIQIFGTFFKFIPLIIAFVAGFVLLGKDGAMFSDEAAREAIKETGGWSTSNWNPVLFFRGFGGVLLAFDGFIYLANQQKTYTHKDVVPKGIFFGMMFAAIFYVLMAISLFLGSPDGSVVKLFEKLFGNNPQVATLISNLLLMSICLLNINLFVMIGVRNIQSDLDAKLLYAGARAGKVSNFKSGIIQGIVASLVYMIFILMGFFANPDGPVESIKFTSDNPVTYIQIMASIAGVVSFLLIDLLIISALINRKTKRVAVEPVKNMVWCGWIAVIFISIFVVSGLYSFLDPRVGDYAKVPWTNTTGFYFLILLVGLVGLSAIAFGVQEYLFKLHPFKNGFDGYIEGTDPHPWTFRFNWKENYFQSKKAKKEVKYKIEFEETRLIMKKLNWPNRLSILRLALAVVVMILVITSYYGEVQAGNHWSIQAGKYELSYLMLVAGIFFILASLTDFLDGYLARKNNQVTTLGKFLDPIADKILVNSVLIMFAVYGILPIWMTTILILRDIMVDFLRMMLSSNGITLSAGIYGKLKTVFQMVGLTILFFVGFINFKVADPTVLGNEYSYLNQILMIPMYLATFFSIFSGVKYFMDGIKNLKGGNQKENATV